MSKSRYKAVVNIDFPTALYYNHRAGRGSVLYEGFCMEAKAVNENTGNGI